MLVYLLGNDIFLEPSSPATANKIRVVNLKEGSFIYMD